MQPMGRIGLSRAANRAGILAGRLQGCHGVGVSVGKAFALGSIRFNSYMGVPDYYGLFPKTFPDGAPPASPFIVNNRKLRKEYLQLQAQNHPDLNQNLEAGAGANSESVDASEDSSSSINEAYDTLNDPLKRSQYLLKYDANIDLTSDEATQKYEFADKETLMQILDLHEELESMTDERDLIRLKLENKQRIDDSVQTLNELWGQESPDYDQIALETIRLKYWYNIRNALKEWAPGQPVNMTH